MVRTLVDRILTSAGWTVDTARNPREARARDPLGYDVLIIDVRLGAESGTALLADLRRHDPTAPRRSLLLTGATAADLLPSDVAVLVKPFRAEELIDAVDQLTTGPAIGSSPATTAHGLPDGDG